MCSNFECGNLICINEICEIRLCDTDVPSDVNEICQTCQCSQENGKAEHACKGNPCQNGGTCSTTLPADIQVCFIINIMNFPFRKSFHIETSKRFLNALVWMDSQGIFVNSKLNRIIYCLFLRKVRWYSTPMED